MSRKSLAALLCLSGLLAPQFLQAQAGIRDLVVTSGFYGERYQGNLPTVGTVLQDSTEAATALQGEMAARMDLFWRKNGVTRALLGIDGGVRQFSAYGFEGRDFAPKEWVGSVDLTLFQPIGAGSNGVQALGGYRGRRVQDRAPMPLFLQPDQRVWYGGGGVQLGLKSGWEPLSLIVLGEQADYQAPVEAPQIRLLNRETLTSEIRWGHQAATSYRVDVTLGFDGSRYPEQTTFVAEDPVREDQTYRGRLGWSYQGDVLARAGLEGRINRSNSRRPEYRSLTLDGQVTTVLPGDLVGTLYVVLSRKEYREAIPFARLLPGEEANSASLAYITLSRTLARNLDGAVRVGWSRAETETGGEYFQRYGFGVLMNYRPGW